MTRRAETKAGCASVDLARIARRLKTVLHAGDRIIVGLSGGVDSVVLLDVLKRLETRLSFTLEALHVNHQLSPHALSWTRFCRRLCRARGVRLRVVRVVIERGNSTERGARDARYAALCARRPHCVALAHNADDQAETVMLQLLRGAGVKGLAAMPFARRVESKGKTAKGNARETRASALQSLIIRPLLDSPRSEIVRYARRRKLDWIEDETNLDARYTRNWLRKEVLPRISSRVPAYREALLRAARNLGEAAVLLDDLAQDDAAYVLDGNALRLDALRALEPARAKNLLRFVLTQQGWRMPDAAKLDEALRQVLSARSDSQPMVNLGDCELRRHSGRVHLLPSRSSAPRNGSVPAISWQGEDEIVLPGGRGVLTMPRAYGEGVNVERLGSAAVTIRARRGGERLRPHAARPQRSVKNLLREAGMPPWEREHLPLIYCGELLACVPGVAIDHRFQARGEEPSVLPSWSVG